MHIVGTKLVLQIIPAILLCLMLGSPNKALADAHGNPQGEEQQALVHLSSYTDNLHAVNMALKVATLMAEGGASVTLFVDLEGVRLADKRAPQNLSWGTTAPIAELYMSFIAAGGKILVCPHCAKAIGLDQTNLRKGAMLGTHKDLQAAMLSADKIIDY